MPFKKSDLFSHKTAQILFYTTIIFLNSIITLSFFPIKSYAQTAAPSTYVSPTLYCLGSCTVTGTEPTISPTTATGMSPTTATVNPTSTGSPDTSVAPTEDPCDAGTVSIQHWKKHKKSSEGAIGNGMAEFLQLLIRLIELILQLIGGGSPSLPGTPEPTAAPTQSELEPTTGTEEPTTEPEPCASPTTAAPTTGPTTTAPSQATTPVISGPTATITPTPTVNPDIPGSTTRVKMTFYGSYDNDPKGSRAIAHPVLHQEAGGTGTFADPLTFASPAGAGEYPFGTKIYVPMVQKYFIREDECAVSWTAPNGCGAVTMVDLYVGNPSDSEAVLACEGSLTQDYDQEIDVNPPANLPVDPRPIWDQAAGTCMTPHL